MCGDNRDNANAVLSTKRVLAGREHTCCACSETVVRGHGYVRTALLDEDARSVSTYKYCLRCDRIALALLAQPGVEAIDVNLDCGIEWADAFGGPAPEHVAGLAFWRYGDPLPDLALDVEVTP